MSTAIHMRRAFFGIVPIIAMVLGYGEVCMSQTRAVEGVKNVVLVHGGFVDGSGWQEVYDRLKKDGYNVTVNLIAGRPERGRPATIRHR